MILIQFHKNHIRESRQQNLGDPKNKKFQRGLFRGQTMTSDLKNVQTGKQTQFLKQASHDPVSQFLLKTFPPHSEQTDPEPETTGHTDFSQIHLIVELN